MSSWGVGYSPQLGTSKYFANTRPISSFSAETNCPNKVVTVSDSGTTITYTCTPANHEELLSCGPGNYESNDGGVTFHCKE